jgi:hypothetical protein
MVDFLSISTKKELKAVLESAPIILKIDGVSSEKRFETESIQLTLKNLSDDSHNELSAIECIRRDLTNRDGHIPVMKQGTVLRLDFRTNSTYLVCVQPVCDSVRIKKPTDFSFVEVQLVTDNGKFTHVLRIEGNDYIRLNIKPSSTTLRNYKFNHDPTSRTIKAVSRDSDLIFIGEENRLTLGEFKWIGELKQNVAQAISNNLAANISRVGYDSFEWLRQK